MTRNTLPSGFADRTQLRRWFFENYGYRPGYYSISTAIRAGMPCEPHPILEGKIIFDLEKVRLWVEGRRQRPVQPAPLRAALAR